MKTTEERIHEVHTRLAAALDWLYRGVPTAADQELRLAIQVTGSCWGTCEDCGDRLWRDLLTWNPDAGVPDLRSGGYVGKVQCQPCYRKWENDSEPSQADIEDRAEAVEAMRQAQKIYARDAGRMA